MALKFRRGTTAQKSGSLAFGEPYVNTTLGALQIGLESSDLTIRSVDSSSAIAVTSVSASSFISASSLKVTGNTSIDGNLTLGGNITIGDASSDTLNVVANLSSSLIPSQTNAFDLGSADKIWRDLYISTGSIKFVDGTNVVNTFSSNTLTTILQSTGSTEERLTQIGVVSGSLILSASAAKTKNDSQDISIDNINTFTGSQSTKNGDLATYTGSVETRLTQIGVVSGSLISSASADRVSITNINTFSGSQLTQNTALATITGSLILTASANTQKLTAMEAVSGSWITEAETASFARTNTTNVFTTNQIISGGLDVTGTITANEFHTTYVSSSVMYNSGSNRFGDSVDDLQQLIGIVEITGSIKGTQFNDLATVTGSLIVSASSFESRNASLATITGSLISTASNHEQRIAANEAVSSSYARTNSANTFNGDLYITGAIEIYSSSWAELRLRNSNTNVAYHIQNTSGGNFSIHNDELGASIFRIDSGSIVGDSHAHLFAELNVSKSIYAPNYVGNTFSASIAGGGFSGSINGIGNVTAFSSSIVSQFGVFNTETASLETRATQIGIVTGSLISSASSFESRNASLATVTGSLISSASTAKTTNDSQDASITNLNTTTASLNTSVTNLNTFSSSQLTKDSTLATYTASVETRLTEIGIVSGSLITSASTAKSTNDSQDVSITNLNTFSGSQLTKDSTLQTYTASVDNRLTEIGVVSGSLISSASAAKTKNDSQDVSLTNLNSYTASLQAGIQMTGSTVSILGDLKVYGTQSVITSTNVQIQDNIIYLSPTASIDNDLGIVGHYNDGTYRHAGIFMDASDGHTWKVFNGLTDETSAQVDVNGTGFTLADFKAGAITGTSFNGSIIATNGVISGSSQVNLASVTGNSTSNVTEGTNLYYLDSRVKTKLNAEGVISGSSQIDATATTNWVTGIKTRLDANTVVSGSSQVISILSSLNSYTASNDSTNTSQNTSITNLNSATASLSIETSNLETFSASVLSRFTTLASYTGSNDTTNSTQNTRLTALEASASTALSTNNTQATSITNLNSTTASLNTSVSNLNSFSSSALTRLSNLEGTDISITLTGDVTGTGTITNLANVSFATTIAANSVALGTDTTGDYVASLVAGTGVTLSNNSGESATPTIAIGQAVATSSSPTFAGLTINGAITATGDITAYYTSDKRHKNNIQIIPNALSKVRALNGVTWEWNDDVNEVTKSTPKTGLIAQEVQSVLPEVVIEKVDGFLGLDYSKMMGLMVEAIKEQQLQIDNLTLKIAELEKQKGL